MGLQYSWARLGESNGKPEWGVKVSGNIGEATGLTGKKVEVQSRSGKQASVTLGPMRDHWNGGRAAVYAVVRAPKPGRNGSGEQQPLSDRSDKLYLVRMDVIELDVTTGAHALRKRWQTPIAAQNEKLWRETGVDLARCALNEYSLLDGDGTPGPEGIAAVAAEGKPSPARPSAKPARKRTTATKGA